MRYRKTFILLLLMLTTLHPHVGFSQGVKVAVMPMEDLSRGGNGLNLAITQRLSDGMAAKGFAMADQNEVITFMVKNRVRWLGYLGSQYVRRLHDDLGVEYLLLGSVNQRRVKKPFALGLTLQLIRTGDAQIIWAQSTELSGADEIGLLGLSQPQDMDEMEEMVVRRALLTIPADFQHGRPLDIRETIESVEMGPEILKPGDMVLCRIKLGVLPASLFYTSVSLYVDERIIEASYHEDENSFVASWPAALKNERYPVMAAISRPGVANQEVLIGSYLVDNQIPALTLQLKGQELNGIVVLQKNVAIVPLMKNPEPISRWLMTVRDKDGVEIMNDEGWDSLPDRFSWWGQAKNGALVGDGFYTINLTVWDRAGNKAFAEEAIRVIRREPKIVVAMKEQENSLALNLEYDGEIPLAYWRLEIQNQNGDIISESSGTESTGSLMMPLAAVAGQNMSYRLYAQDMLGNRLRRNVAALVPVEEKKTEGESDFFADKEVNKMALREIWVEDF
ncbi:MAG: hypothetical protein KKD73_13680 [Proteobacteria bacterium]|nr:hypothetical protein [Pseudomonadota bacterium]MBU1640441.1 hypothetical protein [Pseudomonadota bacterium]